MFTFHVATGKLTENGQPVEGGNNCYSGVAAHRNDQAFEQVQGEGPIPRGRYRIGPVYDDTGHLGPVVMHLDPLPGTNTFGRSAFRIHGDNSKHDASHGCVICSRPVREHIAKAQDRVLEVV